jgi:hypothetical protein
MNETQEKPSQKLGFFMAVALVMGNMIGSGGWSRLQARCVSRMCWQS